MLVVAFVSFSLFNFVGDPINNMVGEETSDEERSELRETLGLMDPIHVQFSRFVVNASKGEFGISYQLRRPVSELISVENLDISFFGRNIAILSSDIPYIDPQIITGSGNNQGLENAQVPSTRSFGLILRANF